MADVIDRETRLETLGRLTSSVAHEINTPIHYIGDNTTFLRDAFQQLIALVDREQLEADPKLRFMLDEVPRAVEDTLRGVDHVARIVRALRQFGHESPEAIRCDPAELVDYALVLGRSQWKRICRVEAELGESLPAITAPPGPLVQALLNLVVNAAHAVEDRFGATSLRDGTVQVIARVDEATVTLDVRDNGCGIPESQRDAIFAHFFTTKKEGRGTGQGLAIVRELCESEGWKLGLESEVDHGTTISLELPIATGGRS